MFFENVNLAMAILGHAYDHGDLPLAMLQGLWGTGQVPKTGPVFPNPPPNPPAEPGAIPPKNVDPFNPPAPQQPKPPAGDGPPPSAPPRQDDALPIPRPSDQPLCVKLGWGKMKDLCAYAGKVETQYSHLLTSQMSSHVQHTVPGAETIVKKFGRPAAGLAVAMGTAIIALDIALASIRGEIPKQASMFGKHPELKEGISRLLGGRNSLIARAFVCMFIGVADREVRGTFSNKAVGKDGELGMFQMMATTIKTARQSRALRGAYAKFDQMNLGNHASHLGLVIARNIYTLRHKRRIWAVPVGPDGFVVKGDPAAMAFYKAVREAAISDSGTVPSYGITEPMHLMMIAIDFQWAHGNRKPRQSDHARAVKRATSQLRFARALMGDPNPKPSLY